MKEYGTHNQPKGTLSDDTSMFLATMHSIAIKGLNVNDIVDKFVEWHENFFVLHMDDVLMYELVQVGYYII